MADPTSLSWWLTQLGPSGVIIFMIWRVLVFLRPIVLEFVPYFKDLLLGHINLMQLMGTQIKDGVVVLKKVSDSQDSQHTMIEAIHNRVVLKNNALNGQ